MKPKNVKASVAVVAGNKKIKPAKEIILQNVLGEDVDPKEYFFSDGTPAEEARGSIVPPYFNSVCGLPVTREELLEVFNKIFKPEDGFLFYKTQDKEVYVIIIPLRFSIVGEENNALSGDFQKHAISFIAEGSANPETLKLKLKMVAKFVKYTDK